MAIATNLNVRLDPELHNMLAELTAFYGKPASDLGLDFNRSDCVRVILRAAYRDMQDKMAGAS